MKQIELRFAGVATATRRFSRLRIKKFVGKDVSTTFRRGLDFAIGTLLVLAAWQIATMFINAPLLFPGPATIAPAALEMMRSGQLWSDLFASLSRVAVGYVLGVVFGVVLGILIGVINVLDRFFSPVISFVRVLPPVALVPVAVIWFGIGEPSKYFIVMYTALIAVLLSTVDGIRNTPRVRLLAAYCLGAAPKRAIWDVVLPSAIPFIWTGMKISIGFAWMSVVAAELISASHGIGALIMNASQLIEVNRMFVGLAALALVGGVTERIVTAVVEHFFRPYLQHIRS